MNETLDTIILYSFRISFAIALFIIIYKRASSVQTINEDLKKLIYRYFSCYIALFLAAFIQMPYRYHLLLNKGLSHAQISEIFGIANIFVALWNLFMPIALKKLGHANLCIIVALSYFFNSGILAFGSHFIHFVIAGCLQGLTMPTAMMALMDYWMTEELLLPQNSNANYIFNEQRVAISLFMSSFTSMISNSVALNYGVEAIFSFTLSIPLASIILLVGLLRVKDKPEEKSIGGDFSKLNLWLTESPKNIIIIFTEIAFASSIHIVIHHMSAFLFTPTYKPSMGYVQGVYGVFDIISTQIFSLISKRLSVTLWAMLLMVVMAITMLAMLVFYDNKIIIFFLIGLTSSVISVTHGVFIEIRKLYYPGRIRNYIMTIVKLPTSLVSFAILWFTKEYSSMSLLIVASIVMIWGAFFSFLVHIREKCEVTEDQLLEDEIQISDKIEIKHLENFDEEENDENESA